MSESRLEGRAAPRLAPRMSRLVVEGLSKRFGSRAESGTEAVRDVSFAVEPGECLALVGPSGCGKTTTLRLIAGLETPDAGCVKIDGRDVTRAEPGARQVSMVFQSLALLPHLRVRDNVSLPLRLGGMAAVGVASAVEVMARRLGLIRLLDRLPEHLSGGERQRAALARALIQEPAILLLDEPLASLDPPLRSELRTLLRELRRERRLAVVHVTHDQAEALALGDSVAVMQAGKFEQIGAPNALYERPANRAVAAFFGTPPMNLFSGRIDTRPDGAGLQFVGDRSGRGLDDSFSVSLPLQGLQPGPIVLGIRPEHVRIQAGSEASLQFHPIATEFAGIDWIWYGEVAGHPVALRTSEGANPDRVPVRVGFPAERLHWFHAKSGQRIRPWS